MDIVPSALLLPVTGARLYTSGMPKVPPSDESSSPSSPSLEIYSTISSRTRGGAVAVIASWLDSRYGWITPAFDAVAHQFYEIPILARVRRPSQLVLVRWRSHRCKATRALRLQHNRAHHRL